VSGLKRYVAVPGDYLVKIASEHGTTWQGIWNHPANAEHRRKRESPDVLMVGDVLMVPVAVDPPPPEIPKPVEQAWPYPAPSEQLLQGDGPRWACPGGTCECHAPLQGRGETIHHVVFLHDDQSQRMGAARYRLWVAGALVADASADPTGAIEGELPEAIGSVFVEWAPASLPVHPSLPFRRRYHLRLGESPSSRVGRRLEHIGVRPGGALADRTR
jgi:hypothetical protein